MDNNNFKEFSDQKIKEIKIWAWIAAVLPISSLAALFFIWAFGTTHWLNIAMVTGSTVMFTASVIWWWWALHAMTTLLAHWDKTKDNVTGILHDVKEVKNLVKDLFAPRAK